MSAVLAERPPRSLSIHYMRPPAAGPAEIAVTVERQGRAASFLSARLEQEGKVSVRALAAFSDPWQGPSYEALLDAQGPPPEEFARLLPEEQDLPAFFHNYEMVPAIGSPPFLSGEEPVTGGWIRSRKPRALDPPLAAAILDAWIPTAFIVLDRAPPRADPRSDDPLPLAAAAAGQRAGRLVPERLPLRPRPGRLLR